MRYPHHVQGDAPVVLGKCATLLASGDYLNITALITSLFPSTLDSWYTYFMSRFPEKKYKPPMQWVQLISVQIVNYFRKFFSIQLGKFLSNFFLKEYGKSFEVLNWIQKTKHFSKHIFIYKGIYNVYLSYCTNMQIFEKSTIIRMGHSTSDERPQQCK